MEDNRKFVIAIEEVIVKEFEIIADTAEKTMEIAQEKYKKGIFVLSPGEVQVRQMAIVKPEKEVTEWREF